MHPPLDRPHPYCQDVIDALRKCHEDNPYMKFLGSCNEPKAALDQCFRAEKEVMRKANAERARESRRRAEERMARDRAEASA
ncbi:COX assembly mitochondrial protein 2 [Hondaea fermentalgiana]|uniref:COX assembly mitochondrial protein n=1 Tax=Hondaea fermentalgiana TaxID=2315210 RepID=A0A2R5GHB7_9STRA|nr:COX assembly mitochondrial protein 2 [Hondaea fermentalgiana]|eukprot:GBG29975.1 COX assembly mitochondrial protein 2 [Hondaea fermentalgiana]